MQTGEVTESPASLENQRQWPHLQHVLSNVESDRDFLGVIVIGSFASGRTDELSDLDLLIVAGEGRFAAAWQRRQQLHRGRVIDEWDVTLEEESAVGVHKWLTDDLVLVECLIAEPGGVRLAPPYSVAVGPPTLSDLFPDRRPIERAEMTETGLHPIEVAYDRLKSAVRSHKQGAGH